MTNKNILLISPQRWGSNYVSKHHYALSLSRRGNVVYFLQPFNPETSIHANIEQVGESLYVIDYRVFFRGLGRMPKFISALLTRIEYQRMMSLFNIHFDMIWNFDTSRFFNLKRISTLKLAHIVDYNEDFNRDLLARTSDICLCTTDYIKEELEVNNSNVFKIFHGYGHPILTHPKESRGNDSIRVGYVGNLSIKYIDWDLMKKLVKAASQVNFYFYGPYETSNLGEDRLDYKVIRSLEKFSNVHFKGPKKWNELPELLSQMDVLLICYKYDLYPKQLANPHKLMEYLGSGKVVLATWTQEYLSQRHLIEMATTEDELLVKFDAIVKNIDYYNSESKMNQRIAFAADNTYDKQIERIEKIIETNDSKASSR